ncbi:cyclase family protein [Neolewinella antarctica]|uniref:Arylformamidase n=1 Tax=Neolewinella antarctica TaxID=442734 RepID=A0ABX0X848_9BACT|nr:cyclase family protein [Neolewinella antarctica]NJC25392.1 arylformamidase [Neolewinella antarctica]
MSNWYEGWTDVTYPIFEGMTGWPGQPSTSYDVLSCIHCGDTARVTVVKMSVHSGTHMDAPSHFLAQGIDVSRAPIDFGMGPVRVAVIDCPAEVKPKHLEAFEKRTRPLVAGERLMLRTPNSDRKFWLQDPFDKDYRGIGPEAAAWIAERKLKMVGVDYLSVGPFYNGNPQTHRALMTAGVWIVEGIDLRKVGEGDFEMICLPLKLVGSDGSPVRILLRAAG